MSVMKTGPHFPYSDPMVNCSELCQPFANQADIPWDKYLFWTAALWENLAKTVQLFRTTYTNT